MSLRAIFFKLAEPEWYAETYSVRSEQHFALLLFWIHAEVMRRSVGMAYRQALLRSRRLQFRDDKEEILEMLRKEKMHDSQMMALIGPEDESEDGITLGARARVRMQNTKRTFTASRGITKVKGEFKVTVSLPDGTQKVVGVYLTNVEAALEHDREIRLQWPSEQSERMVNMTLENTQRVCLEAATTPSLMKKWPNDDKRENNDADILSRLRLMDPKSRKVRPLHLSSKEAESRMSLSGSSSSSSGGNNNSMVMDLDGLDGGSARRSSGAKRKYNKNPDCNRWN